MKTEKFTGLKKVLLVFSRRTSAQRIECTNIGIIIIL